MTTPEQLAEWHKEAFRAWCNTRTTHLSSCNVFIEGYLHTKQETHQEITQLKADIADALRAITEQAVDAKAIRKQVSQEALEIFHRTYPSTVAQLFEIMEFINEQ